MERRYWVETLGCPKNEVDSHKLEGTLIADGMQAAATVDEADLIVVNTCAFIEPARQESIDVILALREQSQDKAELVVTGCMAERYGDELAAALPEADAVAPFGVPVTLGPTRQSPNSSFDLLELPRPPVASPWAYVKVAEGCDRKCGFCAIPSFRGPQRSRTNESILKEIDALDVAEVVLVAQDLVSFGRDQGQGELRLSSLVTQVAARIPRVRLLYLHPSGLSDELIEIISASSVPYFDLSLQHVSTPLLRKMRRVGSLTDVLHRVNTIRSRQPDAVFRTNFIIGYPGETEADHDELLRFIEQAQLDWCGLFAYSPEPGTYAYDLDPVPSGLVTERLNEASALADSITATRRDAMVGRTVDVLVDQPGVGRSWAEAPEIDGVIRVPENLHVGKIQAVDIVASSGPDLTAELSGTGHGYTNQ